MIVSGAGPPTLCSTLVLMFNAPELSFGFWLGVQLCILWNAMSACIIDDGCQITFIIGSHELPSTLRPVGPTSMDGCSIAYCISSLAWPLPKPL